MTEIVTESKKPIHSLILDTGPLIKNEVSISTMIHSAEKIFTTPAILSEIKDEVTRSRVQTTLIPFLEVQTPSTASYDAVIAFSKKTGDYSVLSRQDLGILALAYEVHCERNGGNWGLRDAPKQPIKKRLGEETNAESAPNAQSNPRRRSFNHSRKKSAAVHAEKHPEVVDGWEQPQGKRAVKSKRMRTVPDMEERFHKISLQNSDIAVEQADSFADQTGSDQDLQTPLQDESSAIVESQSPVTNEHSQSLLEEPVVKRVQLVEDALDQPSDRESSVQGVSDLAMCLSHEQPTPPATDSESDGDGDWITPSNLAEKQVKDSDLQPQAVAAEATQMDVATMTTDFAMQNVLLQMNLNLLSTNMQRIKRLSTKVLRCHACFNIVKEMEKQFCPRCGQASLQRVSCSTDAKGNFRVHLSKNYQWNTRGDKYAIPKPVGGTSSGKWNGQGGGKEGWGRNLILAEDQKEYQRQVDDGKRSKARDLMDEDYLPGILTGDRGRMGGRPRIGVGKNVNSKNKR